MADRLQYFFRQRVTEAELNEGFTLLERADRHLASDLGVFGIVGGAVPTPHAPVADLSLDLTGPATAYDHLGQRIYVGTGQSVNCAVDLAGVPTEVTTPGRERWLGVFMRFRRLPSDPRTDGNSQQLFFRQDESFEVVVRQGADAAIGSAQRVGLPADELLVCDVRRHAGQTQLLAADLDLSRRQAFVFARGSAVGVDTPLWNTVKPASPNTQAALDAVDAEITGHFAGTARRHSAAHVDLAPRGFVAGATVQAAFSDLIDKLTSTATSGAGASRIGADAVVGTPLALPPGSVDSQLAQLLAWLNAHVGATTNGHSASAIGAQPHAYITGTSVQAQLQELVADLQSTNPSLGSAQVGSAAIPGAPYALATGTARAQLAALLGHLNGHAAGGDHDARYWKRTERVNDADTVDGQHASSFATAGHDHDDRYLRRVFTNSDFYDPNQSRDVTVLAVKPDLVTTAYNFITAQGLPEATTYVQGVLTPSLRCWVTKLSAGGGPKTYRITVANTSTQRLYVSVAAYARS